MSRNKHKKHGSNQGSKASSLLSGAGGTGIGSAGGMSASQPTAPPVADLSIQEIVNRSEDKLIESMESADLAERPTAPTQPDEAALRKAWADLSQAKATYEAARARHESQQQLVQTRLDEVERSREELKKGQAQLMLDQESVSSKTKELASKEQVLLAERETLQQQHAQAEAGFLDARRAAIAKLDEVIAKVADDAATQMALLATRRQEFLEQIARSQDVALQDEWKKLEGARRDLAREKRQLEWDVQDHQERQRADLERNKALVASQIELLEAQCAQLQQRLDAARKERDDLYAELQTHRRVAEDLGDRAPEALHKELELRRQEVNQLRERLQQAPDPSVLMELQSAKAELDSQAAIMRDRELLLAQKTAALDRAHIAVGELETVREERRVLLEHKRLLDAKLTDLQNRLDQFINGEAGRSPFPECRRMDEDRKRQVSPAVRPQVPDLARFVADLQLRIAHQSSQHEGGRTLYYSQRDLRAFLGGLAMSPLHILQGISGTGKTSLPLAFAEAVGAGRKLIAVQAGWRDRQDLLGHYNTFEKRYYETEFLQALYEAQTPEYSQRLYLIVLDEMNLSHPEQYAADLLSELERPTAADRKLDLMTAQVSAAPQSFIDGRRIRIPRNVWFVGTANHDETTKDFADKTYDRAHVMELPRHREVFKFEPPPELEPLSADAVDKAFANARRSYGDQATRVYECLDRKFAAPLAEMFDVSWGNRLERQANLYVPVVIAAGGNAVEALDHLMATKVLRRIRDRHDIRPPHYVALRDLLQKAVLTDLIDRRRDNGMATLDKSIELVQREIHRLGIEKE